jgi:hypothetical protein
MSPRTKVTIVAVAAVSAVAVAGASWTLYRALAERLPSWSGQPQTRAYAENIVVMPTAGGQLEIATVTATEVFERRDPKILDPKFFDRIDLGTTVSRIRVEVVYRYHIRLATQWRLEIRGTTCIVRAGAIEPTLPVALDTATMEKYTASGWARFNKAANLEALEQSLTRQLAERAPRYRSLAADSGRHVVARFVNDWLLRERGWGGGPPYKVVVLFPGEQAPAGALDRAEQ